MNQSFVTTAPGLEGEQTTSRRLLTPVISSAFFARATCKYWNSENEICFQQLYKVVLYKVVYV